MSKRLTRPQRDKLKAAKDRKEWLDRYCGICDKKKKCSFCKFFFERDEVQRTINRIEAVKALYEGGNIFNIQEVLKND